MSPFPSWATIHCRQKKKIFCKVKVLKIFLITDWAAKFVFSFTFSWTRKQTLIFGVLKGPVTHWSSIFSYSITQSTHSSEEEFAQICRGEKHSGHAILQALASVPQSQQAATYSTPLHPTLEGKGVRNAHETPQPGNRGSHWLPRLFTLLIHSSLAVCNWIAQHNLEWAEQQQRRCNRETRWCPNK